MSSFVQDGSDSYRDNNSATSSSSSSSSSSSAFTPSASRSSAKAKIALSRTFAEQCQCEMACLPCFDFGPSNATWSSHFSEEGKVLLCKDEHCRFLKMGIESPLNEGFVSLDASRPWIMYWIVHALYLIDAEPGKVLSERIVDTIASMQHPEGGFCGGPGQLAHCAPTYASVLTLATLSTVTSNRSLSIINRPKLYSYFLRMKHPSGGFRMHDDGEVDCRGTYTVLAIARLCNMITDELISGVSAFVLSTQSYEGGFGGERFNEAHGGYNYCAVAALLILKEYEQVRLDELEYWIIMRQMGIEGGFSGRTNKLVDSCYSFWQGAGLAIVKLMRSGDHALSDLEEWERIRALGSSSSSSSSSSISYDASDKNGASASNIKSSSGDGGGVGGKRVEYEEEEVEIEEAETVLDSDSYEGCLIFNQNRLMKYLLYCCQSLGGGMRDKPGKSRDFYHSCYALSGLSVTQHSYLFSNRKAFSGQVDYNFSSSSSSIASSSSSSSSSTVKAQVSYVEEDMDDYSIVYGDLCNLINPTSVAFNIGLSKLRTTINFFSALPHTHIELTRSSSSSSNNNSSNNL